MSSHNGQILCAEGGLVACKSCGCTERSVFQSLRGALAGKNWDWWGVGLGIGIRWSSLPFNLTLIQLTTNYNKNVITQGSGKGEKHDTDTPTRGAVTLFREVTLGPSFMLTQCLVFPKVPWDPNDHRGRIKKGRPFGG